MVHLHNYIPIFPGIRIDKGEKGIIVRTDVRVFNNKDKKWYKCRCQRDRYFDKKTDFPRLANDIDLIEQMLISGCVSDAYKMAKFGLVSNIQSPDGKPIFELDSDQRSEKELLNLE